MKKQESITKLIRKSDAILISLILLVAIILAVLQTTSLSSSYSESAAVDINIDGQLYGEYSLNSTREIKINNEYKNVVRIYKGEDGQMYAKMRSADCPGRDCVHQAPINHGGQTIVCLPAKLVVTINSEDSDVDAYTY